MPRQRRLFNAAGRAGGMRNRAVGPRPVSERGSWPGSPPRKALKGRGGGGTFLQNNPMQSRIPSKFGRVDQWMGSDAASAFAKCGHVAGHAPGGNGPRPCKRPGPTCGLTHRSKSTSLDQLVGGFCANRVHREKVTV